MYVRVCISHELAHAHSVAFLVPILAHTHEQSRLTLSMSGRGSTKPPLATPRRSRRLEGLTPAQFEADSATDSHLDGTSSSSTLIDPPTTSTTLTNTSHSHDDTHVEVDIVTMGDPIQAYAAIAAQAPFMFRRKNPERFEQQIEYLQDVSFSTFNISTDKEKLTFTFKCIEAELLDDIRKKVRQDASAADAGKTLPELLTWESFKSYLLGTRPTTFDLDQQVKLLNTKQGTNEDVTHYSDRFRTLAASIPVDECAERTKSILYLRGLQDQAGLGEPIFRKNKKLLQDNITEVLQRNAASLASKHNRSRARSPTNPPTKWKPKNTQLNNFQAKQLKFIPKPAGAEPPDDRNKHWCGWCGKFRDHTSEQCRRNPNPSKGVRTPNAQA